MNSTLKLQPRRSPEPGRPFIDRGYELRLVRDKLEKGIQGTPMPSPVTCFWGTFGMGKSWLLLELERRHRYAGPQVQGSFPTITARLDLNREILPVIWQEGHLDRERLIRELWRQLASQLGDGVPNLEQASADEWAEAFVNQVTAWAVTRATPMIMLDTMDHLTALDEATFFWLEKCTVERLAITDRVLFVFTSRGELQQWKRFQVRRRVSSHKLNAFDANTAGQVVKADLEVGEVLYRHACGHPLVTESLGTALEMQGASLRAMQSVDSHLVPALAQDVLRAVIDEILRPVPELPARLVRYASMLRWVSIEPLRFLAEKLGLVKAGRGDAYYLDQLIGTLLAYHLLYWNSDENSYEFDVVLRKLLTNFLELDEPERFCGANLAAFKFHRDHLDNFPQYLARYVPELAYHRAILARKSPEASLPALSEWWSQFLAERAPTHSEPWTELARVLEHDNELRDTLPAADYGSLYSETQKRAADSAALHKED